MDENQTDQTKTRHPLGKRAFYGYQAFPDEHEKIRAYIKQIRAETDVKAWKGVRK